MRRNKRMEFRKDIREGWDFVSRKPGMLYLLFLSMVSSCSFQMINTILAPFVTRELQGSSVLFAALDISFTVGGALAGLTIHWALSRWKQYVVIGSLVGMGSSAALCGFSPNPTVVGICLFGLGFFTMVHFVTMQTLVQINTPKEMMGRMVGFRSIAVSFAKIASALMTGYLSSLIPPQAVFLIFSGLVAIVLFTVGRVKGIPVPTVFLQRAS
ncbi:MFS transporter [Salinithrix halophila]|uniref:MFS transporter n=1 Tax=Salinithrix halophila TaxID=1485204 RepID=A0ABV8JEB5_9BACL